MSRSAELSMKKNYYLGAGAEHCILLRALKIKNLRFSVDIFGVALDLKDSHKISPSEPMTPYPFPSLE